MSKQEGDILSGMGSGFQIVKALRDAGATDDELRRIIADNSPLPAKIVSVLKGASQTSGDGFTVTVDYSKSLKEMITAGHYDWQHLDITSAHFPFESGKSGTWRLKFKLIHFDRVVTSEFVLDYFSKNRLRRPFPEHVAAFGAEYPEEQRKYPVVGLVPPWVVLGGGPFVLCLYQFGGKRKLDLHWGALDWDADCRFLAVCEE